MALTQTDPGIRHLQEVLQVGDDLRDAPTPEFIQRMRSQFPTEREFDRTLTKKLSNRAVPRRSVPTLEQMSESLESFLHAHVHGDFTVSHQRWLSGGASKIQFAFTLDWITPDHGRQTDQMVARMEPQESLNATSRTREFELLNAFAGTLPVPRVFWVDEDAEWFPESTLIYAFAEGVTKPRGIEGRASGVGSNFGPGLREALGRQFIEHIAQIHTFDHTSANLGSLDVPEIGTTQSALWQLDRARRVWEEDRTEDLPLLEVAANWLERNAPELDTISVLHGDYRGGNFLFDEDTATITAWLDWERGYLGDRHRDLAWITLPQFGHLAEDGNTFLVSGLVTLDAFFSEYEAASGLTVDPARLRYYRILNSYQLIASTLGSGHRVARLGKSHQDVLLVWIEGFVYSLADEMRIAILEEN